MARAQHIHSLGASIPSTQVRVCKKVLWTSFLSLAGSLETNSPLFLFPPEHSRKHSIHAPIPHLLTSTGSHLSSYPTEAVRLHLHPRPHQLPHCALHTVACRAFNDCHPNRLVTLAKPQNLPLWLTMVPHAIPQPSHKVALCDFPRRAWLRGLLWGHPLSSR